MPKIYHILIVDDDPLMRRLFGGKLASAGYEVLYASNGDEGREIARRLHPDLILMDITMPGFEDGFAAAERLKSEEQTKNIAIIFLTNNDLTYDAEKIMKEAVEAKDYIHKSTDLDQFIEKVRKALESREKKEQ
jgi:CheY-like chemotaxis protein